MNHIFGIGTDIVQINRIYKIVLRYKQAFAKRILSEIEYSYYQNLLSQVNNASMGITQHSAAIHYLAKRFAGKEAVAKALGVGIAQGIAFKDIAIVNNALGKPEVHYLAKAQEFVIKHQIKQTFISLADERDFALAYVTIVH